MPLTLASVVGFIPNAIWAPLKKFVTKDGVVTFDLPFKISTKYTPALLIVGVCLAFANQFVRNLEIDCVTGKGDGSSGSLRPGGSVNSDLNDYCWNHDTFLVLKALEPEMQGEVSYPGVSGYRKDRDGVIRQRYYKIVWMILVKMAVFSFLPYFFWRARGVTKIKPLLDVSAEVTEDVTEHTVRVKYFTETLGFNDTFGIYYVFCKIFATLTPVGEYFYLCGVIGPRYKYFGVQVFAHFLDETAPWPNPMDVLFPKMAKCNWITYGFGGDSESKSAICQLPMNNLTQWTFFVFWWWMAFTFVINVLSLFRVSLFMCGLYRRYSYRSFVSRACRDDVEKGRSCRGHDQQRTGKMKRFSTNDVIMVKLSFGDVMVLSFIKRNLQEWEFREFMRTFVSTKNHVLQLRRPKPVKKNIPFFKKAKQEEQKVEMGFIMPNSIEEDNSSTQTSIAPSTILPPYSDLSTITSDGRGEEDSVSCDPWPITLKDPVKLERRSSSKNWESKSSSNSRSGTKDKKTTGSVSTRASEPASSSNTSWSAPSNVNYKNDDNGTDADWEGLA